MKWVYVFIEYQVGMCLVIEILTDFVLFFFINYELVLLLTGNWDVFVLCCSYMN